jgi:hypothetical protein
MRARFQSRSTPMTKPPLWTNKALDQVIDIATSSSVVSYI